MVPRASIDDMTSLIEQALGLGWIRCDERLPDAGSRVLVWHSGWALIGVHEPRLRPGWRWKFGRDEWLFNDDVTHWKPLPAAPEKP